ncbi:MAG: hypothetical protein HWE35_19915 [Rhodobacteraceae bacterium]|nr:hypothetical protein [Paracoccaceae bacterium]
MEIEFGGEDSSIIATVPAVDASWKPIVIRDDGYEVTVFYGDFTHDHYKYYGEDASAASKAQAIARDIIEELAMVFDDQIEFWRTGSSGGMGPIGSRKTFSKVQISAKLWSGKDSP